MANNNQLRGTSFSVTATGTTTAQAVTSGTDVTYYITDISGSTIGSATSTGTWAVIGGATGTTILYQGSGNVSTPISTSLIGPSEGTVSFFVNGTAGAYATFASMSGYFITPD